MYGFLIYGASLEPVNQNRMKIRRSDPKWSYQKVRHGEAKRDRPTCGPSPLNKSYSTCDSVAPKGLPGGHEYPKGST